MFGDKKAAQASIDRYIQIQSANDAYENK